ncbi:MAG: hypothetical protein ACM30H_10740 [Clostridia bacterium]
MATTAKKAAWAVGACGVVVALLAAVPFLVPLDAFLPDLTRIAAEKLGQPVSIATLRLAVFPTPRAVAGGIVVGKRQEVAIGTLEIVPDLVSMIAGPKAIRLVRAEDVALKEAALAIPAAMPKAGAGGEPVRVRRLELVKVKLQHSKLHLPEFDLQAELGEGYVLDEATLRTRDDALRLVVDPQDDGIAAVILQAERFTIPAGPPLRFERLSARGTLKGEQLDLPQIDGRLYGGSVAGSAHVTWGKAWQVSGKAAVDGVDLIPVQKALGKKAQLSGKLKADATFSSRARTPEQLKNALVLDGPFQVVGGAYHGYDLSKMSIKQLEAGGSTPFDELRGEVQVRGKEVKISELCVRSPSLVAGGNVAVAPDDKLSGRLDLSLTKTGGFVGMPVSLGGTTKEPSFSPTKGYVIGAAVGTLLLPGIGTSIGASAGGRMEGSSNCK